MMSAIDRATPRMPPPAVEGARIGAWIAGAGGGFWGLIFPVCVIVFYNRQVVVDAFRGVPARGGDFGLDAGRFGPPPLPGG